jgi:hypothetical protein
MGPEVSMSLTLRFCVVLVAFCAGVPAQDHVTVDEILALLSAGVSTADVDSLVERRGAPAAVQESDLLTVRAAGGSDELQRRLATRLRSHQRLRDLAARFDVWQHEPFGISFLHPKGWMVSPSLGEDRALISVQRDGADPLGWFDTPRLFVWVQRNTPFPRSSQPELAAKIARLVEARMATAGMEPRNLTAGLAQRGSRAAPEHRMLATAPETRFQGSLILRTRIMGDGAVVTIGYACTAGDEESVRALFAEFSRSLSVRTR